MNNSNKQFSDLSDFEKDELLRVYINQFKIFCEIFNVLPTQDLLIFLLTNLNKEFAK